MLHPLRDNIIVAALDDPSVWYGSSLIIRPESTKDRSDQGIVKAVGPEVRELQVGDYVAFQPYAGTAINDADEGFKLIMLSERGIIARVTSPTTVVDSVFIRADNGFDEEFVPATAEALILLLREAYQKVPRVIELRNKFEDRLKDGIV